MIGVSRLRVLIRGAVQGVGFRPFVYRLARELDLAGWVSNSPQGVLLEVEGPADKLEQFKRRVDQDKPSSSFFQSVKFLSLNPVGYRDFEIHESAKSGPRTAVLLPDIATCPDCLSEILDPDNRHYLYPFTNCTHCGPRFSIIKALPYDRVNTSMEKFEMCESCRHEYEDPSDRRFHAQPNACPVCGPHLEEWDGQGRVMAIHHDALLSATDALRNGKIVAVKGLGGFHLMVDARNEEAVRRLRLRKQREEKPFALLYPSILYVKEDAHVSDLEERLILSPEAPIVLLRRKPNNIAPSVAPQNPYLGIMLPSNPLHHLLMRELNFPVVATSGNLSEEPICIDEHEALDRLGGLADRFLVHDRPIVRHVDDSIAQVILERKSILRRARGYAPLPIILKHEVPPLLATGAHIKNTVAVSSGEQVVLSQHVGDLSTSQALDAFDNSVEDLRALFSLTPHAVTCDEHPDYASSQRAEGMALPKAKVQHHLAHVLACMAEHDLEPPVLGVSWDGTGLGPDGTIWGGEFLLVDRSSWSRAAHLRTFCLPGGESAIREPLRSAFGVLHEIGLSEDGILRQMIQRGINSPRTSSAGRLFDAVASLVGLRQTCTFEGQAAMELEFSIEGYETNQAYPMALDGEVIDWEPMVRGILEDLEMGLPAGAISAKFQNALVESIILVAQKVREKKVVLTGGCFQNRYLTGRTVLRLREEGFQAYWHHLVPPNDGGVSLGQIVAAGYGYVSCGPR